MMPQDAGGIQPLETGHAHIVAVQVDQGQLRGHGGIGHFKGLIGGLALGGILGGAALTQQLVHLGAGIGHVVVAGAGDEALEHAVGVELGGKTGQIAVVTGLPVEARDQGDVHFHPGFLELAGQDVDDVHALFFVVAHLDGEGEALAVAGVDAVRALFPAQALHLGRELFQVIGIDVGSGVAAQRAGLDGAEGREALARQHAVHDGLLVHGVVEHRDGVLVALPEGRVEVHGHRAQVGGGEVHGGEAVLAAEGAGILGVEPGQVGLAGTQHEGLGALHGHGLVDDTLDGRHLAVIVRVALQHDHAAGRVPGDELEAAGAHGSVVGGHGVDVVALIEVGGQDAHAEIVQHGRIDPRQPDDHGALVRGRDPADVLIVAGDGGGQGLVAGQGRVGVDHVPGAEGRAVVPFDPVAQVEGIGQGLGIIVHALGQVGHGQALGVELHEPGKDDGGQFLMGAEHGVDGVLVLAGIDQGVGHVGGRGRMGGQQGQSQQAAGQQGSFHGGVPRRRARGPG